jgi:hypothetical protein
MVANTGEFSFFPSVGDIDFAPKLSDVPAAAEIGVAAPNKAGTAGSILLRGHSVGVESIYLPRQSFLDALRTMVVVNHPSYLTTQEEAFLGDFDTQGNFLFNDGNLADTFITGVYAAIEQKIKPLSQGLRLVTDGPLPPDAIAVDMSPFAIFKGTLFGIPLAILYGDAHGVDLAENTQSTIVDQRQTESNAELVYRLSEAINPTLTGETPTIYIGSHFYSGAAGLISSGWTRDQLINQLAQTIVHESGHRLGLLHTNRVDLSDIMSWSDDFTGSTLSFHTTLNAALMALGADYTPAMAQDALDYIIQAHLNGDAFGTDRGAPGVADGDGLSPVSLGHGLLDVYEAGTGRFGQTLDFATLSLAGGSTSKTLMLVNLGDQPVRVNSAQIVGGEGEFTLHTGFQPTTIAPGGSTPLVIDFLPAKAGPASATLVFSSDGLYPILRTSLAGVGQDTGASLGLTVAGNNLGGVPLAGGTAQNGGLATITNYGAKPLVISDVRLVEGSGVFTLLGLPANLATNPISLPFGQSVTFGVSFRPDRLGLERALIDVVSNDPVRPTRRLSAVGTGLDTTPTPVWGHDYVAVETPNLPGAPVLRTVSNDQGDFQFFLPQQQEYHIAIYDPKTGLIAQGYGTTPPSGQGIDLTADLVFGASTATDRDFDGLPDDIEFAVGTSPTNPDTNGDGLDDFTELQQGLDPLAGVPARTGVLASLALPGETNNVVVTGNVGGPGQTAYVAAGSAGLAVVDASRFDKPALFSQLGVPGTAVDVAVDPTLRIAAVAAGTGGLHRIDVSNPLRPRLLGTNAIAATQVEAADGIAYAAAGGTLYAIDLATGEVLQGLTLSANAAITGLARAGEMLYAMDDHDVLRAVDVSNLQMQVRGSATLPAGGGKLSVAGTIAYAVAADSSSGGFASADVTNPDHITSPTLWPPRGPLGVPRSAFVPTGSGYGVLVGREGSGLDSLTLVDLHGATTSVATQVPLPTQPLGVALASGIAYVADGSAGLQVVNYLPFDTKGQPPTASISSPGTAGPQLVEGSTIPVQVTVSDDVQVRNVELLLNGQVVANDVSAPFEFFATAPTLASGATQVTLQVRATDTGGNVALSNTLTYSLVRGKGLSNPLGLAVSPRIARPACRA